MESLFYSLWSKYQRANFTLSQMFSALNSVKKNSWNSVPFNWNNSESFDVNILTDSLYNVLLYYFPSDILKFQNKNYKIELIIKKIIVISADTIVCSAGHVSQGKICWAHRKSSNYQVELTMSGDKNHKKIDNSNLGLRPSVQQSMTRITCKSNYIWHVLILRISWLSGYRIE